MTPIEKMKLFLRVVEGEVKIEYKDPERGWLGLTYNPKHCALDIDSREEHSWNFSSLMAFGHEIRIVKELPLITKDECQFLSYFPSNYYLTKSLTGVVHVHEHKPKRNEVKGTWFQDSSSGVYLPFRPAFTAISWHNADCYTIQELRDYCRLKNERPKTK